DVERVDDACDLVVEAPTHAADQQRECEHQPRREDADQESAKAPLEVPQARKQHWPGDYTRRARFLTVKKCPVLSRLSVHCRMSCARAPRAVACIREMTDPGVRPLRTRADDDHARGWRTSTESNANRATRAAAFVAKVSGTAQRLSFKWARRSGWLGERS